MIKIGAGIIVAAVVASPAIAAETDAKAGSHAFGGDVFYSSDSEHSETLKLGLDFDLRWDGPADRLGLRVERARFSPLGQRGKTMERVYVRIADDDKAWKWDVLAGSDGHTALGSASIHNDALIRQEYFLEREIVETPIGISKRLYSTFAGAAVDVPLNERNVVTLVGGLQEFTGDNIRTHLRATYVHVVKPELGLSVQLRGRYFRNSDPREYDYYSPRYYAEVLPVVQVRRFVGGWQLLAAGGYGVQRDSGRNWRSARYANLRVVSPKFQKDWAANAALIYSNTPTSNNFAYSYLQLNFGLAKSF
ncbi:MAG: hypothetical protein ABIR63_02075 [Sphingomicrobium sp.]